jgi:hypothetical protein
MKAAASARVGSQPEPGTPALIETLISRHSS